MNSNYICGIATFIIKRNEVILKSTEALYVAVGGSFTDGAYTSCLLDGVMQHVAA